jgi:uridine kinase
MEAFLIGIMGPSCSGKSTLAARLAQELDSVVISLDDYWNPEYQPPLVGRWKNRELPGNIDFDHLYRDLADLKSGKSINAPRFSHRDDSFTYHIVEPSPIIIVEGYLLFHDERIRDILDLKAFLDLDDEEMVRRRIARNRSNRPHRHEYYRDIVVAEYRKYGMPAKAHADILLDGMKGAEENARQVKEQLMHRHQIFK